MEVHFYTSLSTLLADLFLIFPPLFTLTRKGVDFCWTTRCQSAFEKMKELLTGATVLAFPNFDREFLLETDASIKGLGAVLDQE